jgi:hypothetical protein
MARKPHVERELWRLKGRRVDLRAIERTLRRNTSRPVWTVDSIAYELQVQDDATTVLTERFTTPKDLQRRSDELKDFFTLAGWSETEG